MAFAASRLVVVSASSGGVAATLSYRHDARNVVTPYSDVRLAIARGGKQAYDAPVANKLCGDMCWPLGVRVLDVEADGEPDVLLDVYSGGAHCCNATEVFRYDLARGSYAMVLQVWGDPGYRLVRLDGSKPYEFVTYDDRFAYEFAAYAFSGLPIEILRLHDGAFSDVTASYPKLVAPDAAQEWRYFLANKGGRTGLGFLAAWAADEYTLGRQAVVTSTLAELEQAGELRGDVGWPTGAKFVAALERFLGRTGYAR
jgi:hypothetical protein